MFFQKFNNYKRRFRNKLGFYPSSLNYHDIIFLDIKKSNVLREIYNTGNFEFEIIKFLDYFEYDKFIDIGSNIGFFSFYVKKIKEWEVNAYEPYSKNCEYIKKIMTINRVKFDLFESAVSNINSKKKFYIPNRKNSSILSCSATLNYTENKKVYKNTPYLISEVKTISFKSILRGIKINEKTLIKVDIEGEEFKIFDSVRESLRKLPNVDFIVEFNINITFNEKLFKLFIQNGFKGYLMTNAGLVQEDRPLTLPRFDQIQSFKACWRNHFFSKKNINTIKKKNYEFFGVSI